MLQVMILMLTFAVAAWAQPNQSNPKDYEVETRQYGGKGWDWYTAVGELRCREGTTQALVGARIGYAGGRVGSLRALCAPVECKETECRTGQPVAGRAAGTQGSNERDQTCPAGQVVSGFRATEQADFLSTLAFECSPITGMTGLKDYSPMPVLFELPVGERRNPATQCVDYGASAFSVAVAQSGYVRAFSLFCGRVTDPRLAWSAGFSRGYSRCVEEQLGANLLLMPVNFLAGKFRALGTALSYIGKSEVIYSLLVEPPDRTSPRAAGEQAGYRFCQALELGKEFSSRGQMTGNTPTPEKWEPAPLPEKQFYKPHVRGNLGERLAAEALAAAGYKIVYYKPDLKGTTTPGFDIIAIKDGHLWIIDNKAYARATGGVLKDVSALTTNYTQNITNLRRDLVSWAQNAPGPVQNVMAEAQQLLNAGKIKLAVTNATVIVEPGRSGITGIDPALTSKGIQFLDVNTLQGGACIPPRLQGVVTAPCELDFVTKDGVLVPEMHWR